MTPDVFRRFLLLLACTAYIAALGLIWIWLAWVLAIVAGVVGPLLALLLTVEPLPPARQEPAVEPEGLSRRDVSDLVRRRA